jgi:hypothetical protein
VNWRLPFRFNGERVLRLMAPPSPSAPISGVSAFTTSISPKSALDRLLVRNSRLKPLFEAIGLPSTMPELSAEGMPRIITFCTFS